MASLIKTVTYWLRAPRGYEYFPSADLHLATDIARENGLQLEKRTVLTEQRTDEDERYIGTRIKVMESARKARCILAILI